MEGLSDDRYAVATVIRTRGSTPRETGAKMVIHQDGTFFGTIGGGCGEAEVWQEARRALRTRQPTVRVEVDLTESADEGGEKICGGKMDVLVDLWSTEERPLLQHLIDAMKAGRAAVLATIVRTGEKRLVDEQAPGELAEVAQACIEQQKSRVVTVGEEEVFLEVLERPPLLVVVGAGHVAQPLCRIGKLLGFRVAVFDDRSEWATRERFSEADDVRSGNLTELLRSLPLERGTYVVLVTRGHKHDEEALRTCLPYPLSYVGMIGSRRRVRAVFADLEREGWDPALLDKVYSPIGLDIGAETPEEIAVAILAEIIKVRRGGRVPSMTLRGGLPRPA